MPSFLIGCGGVLLFNGLQIYDYYKIEKEHDEDEVFVSIEDLAQLHFPPRIHGDDSYIVVEFSGAIASGLFYVSDTCSLSLSLSITMAPSTVCISALCCNIYLEADQVFFVLSYS